MFFNNLSFVGLFFPAVIIGFYWVVPREGRRYFLLTASLLFYAFSGPAYLILLLLDILWVYAITIRASYPGSKLRMCLAIAVPLLALVYFKYLTFILEQIVGMPPGGLKGTLFETIALPIGISFFTFELISYAVDRGRGHITPPASLVNFSLFVAFFPHLVAGPILRYSDVDWQFKKLAAFRLTAIEAQEALVQICIGFFIKVMLADWLAGYVSVLKANLGSLDAVDVIYLVFGFSFQIYFDFFGYSLIAIGLGRLLGIRLPDNFFRPYEALNPREFWRRWHISLSFWLRDYVYFPLGGNKKYVRNILIVFVLCGIWHGAGWNFLAWGAAHAALVIGYHFIAPLWDRQPKLLQRALTFLLVSVAWLPFLFDFSQLIQVLKSLAVWSPKMPISAEAWAALAAAALICAVADADRVLAWLRAKPERQIAGGIAAALALTTCMLFFDRTATFIYFRF